MCGGGEVEDVAAVGHVVNAKTPLTEGGTDVEGAWSLGRWWEDVAEGLDEVFVPSVGCTVGCGGGPHAVNGDVVVEVAEEEHVGGCRDVAVVEVFFELGGEALL